MSSSQDAIKRVVEAFERSDWTEIDVRSGDFRVHLATAVPAGTSASQPNVTPAADDAIAEPGGVPPPPTAVGADRDAREPDPPPAGAHVVASPSPGIFWCSPEPGAPRFVDLGHIVDASATVCIVEVMKLMNHVKAGVGGEVVAVYVQNGVSVQRGQALFAILPYGPSS